MAAVGSGVAVLAPGAGLDRKQRAVVKGVRGGAREVRGAAQGQDGARDVVLVRGQQRRCDVAGNQGDAIMPAGDGTGPRGMGQMRGRAAGLCTGSGMPGYQNPAPGRGLGVGFGRCGGFAGRGGRGGAGGRGWRNVFRATGLPGWAREALPVGCVPYTAPQGAEQEVAALKQQAERLDSVREGIRLRLQELGAKPAEK